jgi:hypothetical protein
MRTNSYRVESRAVRIVTPSRVETLWLAMLRAVVRAARPVMPERWVVELLGLALGGVLVVAATLYAAALVSTWPPIEYRPTPRWDGHVMRTASGVPCCHEAP